MKRVRDAALILLVTLSMLLLLEGGARWMGAETARPIISPWMEFDARLLWKNRPGSHGSKGSRFAPAISFLHNHLGLRMDEIEVAKPPGVFRAAVLGDSNIWGFGVQQPQTACSVLQRMFDGDPPDGRDVEILNMGTIGYSSYQGRIVLERHAFPLEPDLVILSYGYNDRRYVASMEVSDGPDHFSWTARVSWFHERIFGSSAFLNAVVSPLKRDLQTTLGEAAPRVPLDAHRRNFSEMLRLCRERDIPAAVLSLTDNPIETRRLREYRHASLDGRIGDAMGRLADAIRQPNLTDYAITPWLLRNELGERPEAAARALGIEAPDSREEANALAADLIGQIEGMALKIDSVMGMSPIRPDWLYREALEEVCAGEPASKLLDFGEIVFAEDGEVWARWFFPSDPCHLNENGQRRLAEFLYEAILAYIRESPEGDAGTLPEPG